MIFVFSIKAVYNGWQSRQAAISEGKAYEKLVNGKESQIMISVLKNCYTLPPLPVSRRQGIAVDFQSGTVGK